MCDPSKVYTANVHSHDQQHLNSPTTHPSLKEHCRDADISSPTRSTGVPQLCQLDICSSWYLRQNNSIEGQNVGGMSEGVQGRPRFLEADPGNIPTDVQISKCRLCDTLPENKCATCVRYPPNLDNCSPPDSPLGYDSSSYFESFSSFESASSNEPNDINNMSNRNAESRAAVLCGVGQWVDDPQLRCWTSWQSIPPLMDDDEDPRLDLVGIHILAATCPFGWYLRTCQDEEGALDFQMYASLP